ncbi:MAG: nucleotidyltransferase family protein [Actinomycetota bacterium]
MTPRVAALLAAGGGTRYRGSTHKLLAPLHGRPVWEHAFNQVMDAGFDHVIVVTGAAELSLTDGLAASHQQGSPRTSASPHVDLRHNPNWHTGQASSVQLAVGIADELGADTVTIGLADQPFVTSAAWQSVASAPLECRIAIAVYDGTPGPNPVRLHRSIWPLLPTEGDEGARNLLRVHPEWVCHVRCLGSVDTVADIDTPEDLHRWNNS